MARIETPPSPFQKNLSNVLFFAVIGIGSLSLVVLGWQQRAPMHPLTALCFILSALSLLLFNRIEASKLGMALGALVAAIPFFIRQMTPHTAFNFFLIGLALVILDRPTKRWYHPSEFLLLIVVSTSAFVLMGYVYNASSFTQAARFNISMPFNTALGFLIFCLAAFVVRPQHGLMRTLTGEGLGSVTIRRLLPVSIVLPLALSVLSLQGQKAGIYGTEFGTAIYTLSVVMIFALVIWFNAKLLNQMDLKRKLAEEKVMEAARVKSDFTSMVSHELRTPLTVIKESVAIVYDETAGPINVDQKDFLDTAKRNVDRLGRLINAVLDYQKLESQPVTFTMVEQDLNKIIAEIGQSFILPLKSKGLRVQFELKPDLPFLKFDTDKITQVLINLINNAMKFTEKGTITLTSELSGDNAVKVAVTDQGIGIKKEDLGKLFESFSQISTGTGRQTGGTGLGLAISKKIIEKHNGQMNVSSVFGQGTTFYFILPVKERRSKDNP